MRLFFKDTLGNKNWQIVKKNVYKTALKVRLLNRKVNDLKDWDIVLKSGIDVTIWSGGFYEPKVETK